LSISIKHIRLLKYRSELDALPERKLIINTINAHSYNLAQKDAMFAKALTCSDVLIPDGVGIVKAIHWLKGIKVERIAGWDLFTFEMERLNRKGGVCFFLGSSIKVLELIMKKTSKEYTNIRMIGYSPRYKSDFTNEENKAMIDEIHAAMPDLILIGMTAPKQEKWVYLYRDLLKVNCHICAIGAVFDFYAGTVKRAPVWWQKHSLEWLYRLLMEPRRMWKRYIIGNILFIYYIFKEKFALQKSLPEQIQSENAKIAVQQVFATSKANPPIIESVQKKTSFYILMLLSIAIIVSSVGFFLYPVVYPRVFQKDLPNQSLLVTSIENTESNTPDQKDTLNQATTLSMPEIENKPEPVVKSQRNLKQGKYVLVVGSFPTQPEAERYANKLQNAGIECEIINIGNKLFRISIAGFDDKNEAEKHANQVKSMRYCENVWVARR